MNYDMTHSETDNTSGSTDTKAGLPWLAAVAVIREMAAEGHSARWISYGLNQRGIPTRSGRGKWGQSAVQAVAGKWGITLRYSPLRQP